MATDDLEPELKPVETRRIPVGFHVPGIFAGFLHGGIVNGHIPEKLVDDFMRFQDEGHVTCPECNLVFPVTIWTRQDVVRLLEGAEDLTYKNLYDRIAQDYHGFIFECPSCGSKAHLSEKA